MATPPVPDPLDPEAAAAALALAERLRRIMAGRSPEAPPDQPASSTDLDRPDDGAAPPPDR